MSLNREQRRALKKKMGPLAKQIVELEKAIRETNNPAKKEAFEQEIENIMNELSVMEMMALEDYISSKNLLDTK